MRPVLTKRDFTERFIRSEFGNHSPTWGTLTKFLADDPPDVLYHLRNRVAGGETFYNTPRRHVEEVWRSRADPSSWYCSRMVPPEVEQTLKIQGEVQQGPWGLDLLYTTIKKPMRWALAEWSQRLVGLQARLLLQSKMEVSSWEWLNHLLEEYEGHIVEFSTYGISWGTLNQSTIWWECRLY